MAALNGHRDTVELLLDRGADLEAKVEVTPGPVLLRDRPCRAPRAGHKPRWRSCGGMACWGRGAAWEAGVAARGEGRQGAMVRVGDAVT